MDPVVTDFVQEYKNKKWIYARNAAVTARICTEILQAERVPGVVTHRTKDASSLERKLRERQRLRGRAYPTKERIHWEMADLAGVRIVVYLPQDHERVVHALSERFDLELKKSYGAVDTTSVVRKLSWHIQRPGYCATHCWVFLKEDEPQARDGQTRRRVEIQVVTMLRHAWAQFEHDAVYKAQCAMNLEDRQILDSLSCAIDRGEWILNCIPDSGVRNMSSDLLFEMVYEVGCLVAEIAREESRAQGTAKPLLEFLRHLKEAKPKGLCGLMVKERL
ncbi:hypothetical protein ANOM_007541 [Aspergillus nomiae NRRL 13137]|uniref:RelA/SpoT domain-containing protein n=1 Tax=Aspergillus nomiae NRRL (strain ATCC 15546 / NRRL 13137 / CBS 260.88 / M93) TaxID=1509407 RepID=A0A0L1J075_ASPN3|nr:uncharacterized protein ANOM_007541 [Aspergillus nomiae NRRL 13137]KNG84813.1 hypothetical protein ANOM_007541 [Aspergillus nomiae NRRL 13137]